MIRWVSKKIFESSCPSRGYNGSISRKWGHRFLGNQVRSDRAEYLSVIFGLDRLLGEKHLLGPIGFFLNNCSVECFLAGKIIENRGLTDAQPLGDLSSGSSPGTLSGQKPPWRLEGCIPSDRGLTSVLSSLSSFRPGKIFTKFGFLSQ